MRAQLEKNRKGFDKDLFDMDKRKSQHGDSKLYYDKASRVALAQWHDNKVVSVVSTLGVAGKVDVQQRSGQSIINVSTEKYVKEYQEYMGGVDRGDQIRETGAGFCRKAHFKNGTKGLILLSVILCYSILILPGI